jgi:hypothetical protein
LKRKEKQIDILPSHNHQQHEHLPLVQIHSSLAQYEHKRVESRAVLKWSNKRPLLEVVDLVSIPTKAITCFSTNYSLVIVFLTITWHEDIQLNVAFMKTFGQKHFKKMQAVNTCKSHVLKLRIGIRISMISWNWNQMTS